MTSKINTIRYPIADHVFYHSGTQALDRSIDAYLKNEDRGKKRLVRGILVPHGSYKEVGCKLASLYSSIEWPPNIILLGPNLTDQGHPFAVDPNAYWKTPLGKVAINLELRALFMENAPFFRLDELAHANEHTLEIHLPFIQKLSPGSQILPLCVQETGAERCQQIADALEKTVKQYEEPILLIATCNESQSKSISTIFNSLLKMQCERNPRALAWG